MAEKDWVEPSPMGEGLPYLRIPSTVTVLSPNITLATHNP